MTERKCSTCFLQAWQDFYWWRNKPKPCKICKDFSEYKELSKYLKEY